MWSFSLYETITGDHAHTFPEDWFPGNFEQHLESGSGGSVTLPTRAAGYKIPQPELHALTEPTGALLMVVKADGIPCAFGPVLQSPYRRDAGEITLRWGDFGDTFWSARMPFGVNSYPGGNLTVTNRSYAGAVRAVLQRATTLGPTWAMPLDLPADSAGSFSGHWDRWEFRTIKEILNQIRKEGVEIGHLPYLSGDLLRISTLVGSPIRSGALTLSVTAEGSPVLDVEYDRNGQRVITGAIMAGNGSGSGMMTAWAGDPLPGRPIRDAGVLAKEITEQGRLQKVANAEHARNAEPAREFGFRVHLGDVPVSAVLPGRSVRLWSSGDEVIPDGLHPQRVVALRGDASSYEVSPEVVADVS